MNRYEADVAILGAGFGGSLTALILHKIGLRPVLVDRGTHPRFAIGESSTPIADLVLRDLANTYNLPQLLPLTSFGGWQQSYPEVVCGLKRGFSYFQHRPTSQANQQSFIPSDDHSNELLVAASSDDEHSDTHWLRADVDKFFVDEVISAGIPFFDRTKITNCNNANGWILEGNRESQPVRINAKFIIDASGPASLLRDRLEIADDSDRLQTNSRAIFAHFSGVKPWHDFLEQSHVNIDEHPFCCDHSALHHILDGGWMWQLRFNNGITSAGIVLDAQKHPLDSSVPSEQEWNSILQQYPSIAWQFADAKIVAPVGGFQRTNRLQRLAGQMVGVDWAMLPYAAGFIDPLHSTGIAQTLCGIERLTAILANHWDRPELLDELREYENTIRDELLLVDQLVSGCYAAFGNFPLLASFSMLYFAAATTYERRRLQRADKRPKSRKVEESKDRETVPTSDTSTLRHFDSLTFRDAFLCADDPAFREAVTSQQNQLRSLLEQGTPSASAVTQFETELASAIEPFNTAGLCDPSGRWLHPILELKGDVTALTTTNPDRPSFCLPD